MDAYRFYTTWQKYDKTWLCCISFLQTLGRFSLYSSEGLGACVRYVLLCICLLRQNLGRGNMERVNVSCTESFMYVRNRCLVWTFNNCSVNYLCVLLLLFCDMFLGVYLWVFLKNTCLRSIWQQTHSNESGSAGAPRRLCHGHIQPPALHFRWIYPHWDEGAEARLGLWQCQGSQRQMVKAVAPLNNLLLKSAKAFPRERPEWLNKSFSALKTAPEVTARQAAPGRLSQHGVSLWAVGLWNEPAGKNGITGITKAFVVVAWVQINLIIY